MGAVGGGVVNLVKAVYNSPTNRGLRGVEAEIVQTRCSLHC